VTPDADRLEWLEPDGLGGFASGTASGLRTRRYHALLLAATQPPAGRMVLVNGCEIWVETAFGTVHLSSQRYAPGVVHPDGASRIVSFGADPWPCWTYELGDPGGTRVEYRLFVLHGHPALVMTIRLLGPAPGPVRLSLRPLMSGRDYHALHRENGAFRFDPELRGDALVWRPYDGLPGVVSRTNGAYRHAPDWYRNFLYIEERDRGLDCIEDLASPGVFTWDLTAGDAHWMLGVDGAEPPAVRAGAPLAHAVAEITAAEARRRQAFASGRSRAADAYLVRRDHGRTIIAGYPWFTDWGRDTFIAMRGLCLADGRLEEAREILLAWADTVSDGMLPNRFPDSGGEPEYNAVDASLWFVIAAHELSIESDLAGHRLATGDRGAIESAVMAIVAGCQRGTRYGIRVDADGLLAAGVPGVQLTWMDARVGDRVVTPRIGKPVEIQALWMNALRIASRLEPGLVRLHDRARTAFRQRFWNGDSRYLYDVVDVDHEPGHVDRSFRPNQILAVGGLPWMSVDAGTARAIVDAVEARLWTPLGLRSLASADPAYRPRYEGDGPARDGAYHQGTVWPWLAGPFVEAWVRVRGESDAAKNEARDRFLAPLIEHLDTAGLGHASEIADADPPHTPRGCPFQAWSLGEVIRLDRRVLR
jgi:predicted glycogen debranching enzyme